MGKKKDDVVVEAEERVIQRIERVVYYESGSERRSHFSFKNGEPVAPEMSEEAQEEWKKTWKWFQKKGLEHLVDCVSLRDHCLESCTNKSKKLPKSLLDL